MHQIKKFVKAETVLCIFSLLALISLFPVPPDAAYLDYIDFRTLAILFCLMPLGRFSGKWSVCCNRTVYPLPRKKCTTDFICLSSFMLFLQYVHYQRRRTDHICTVDNYCIPHA